MFLPHPTRWDEDDTRELGKAVAIAAATALVAKLVEWGIDTIRDRLNPEEPEAEQPEE